MTWTDKQYQNYFRAVTDRIVAKWQVERKAKEKKK